MIPLEKVNSIILRYDELEKLLSKTNIDKKEFVKNSKEYSSIGSIIKEAKEYQKILKDLFFHSLGLFLELHLL